MKTLKANMIRYKLMEQHLEWVRSGKLEEAKRRGRKSGRKFKFSKADVDTAYHLIQAGVPKKEIARRFNVTVQTIFNYFTPEGEIKQRG